MHSSYSYLHADVFRACVEDYARGAVGKGRAACPPAHGKHGMAPPPTRSPLLHHPQASPLYEHVCEAGAAPTHAGGSVCAAMYLATSRRFPTRGWGRSISSPCSMGVPCSIPCSILWV